MSERVRFYFDPICPWCYQTSRWAHLLEQRSVVELDWGVFSLELQNQGREPEELAAAHARSAPALRTAVVVREHAGDGAVGAFYRAIGRRFHERGEMLEDPATVEAALADAGLDVWAVDASAAMVERLRAKPGAERVHAVVGDMADLALDGAPPFAVVLCAFNTFFNLTATDAQRRAVEHRPAPAPALGVRSRPQHGREAERLERPHAVGQRRPPGDRLAGDAGGPPVAASALTRVRQLPTSVRLRWNDNSGNEAGFIVQRSVGSRIRFTQLALVGDDEADAAKGLIGWNAPIARALRGAGVGDLRRVAGVRIEAEEGAHGDRARGVGTWR